ncbi:Aste57867_21450 [Aphanomyces stellatus]|uniref:Aste57867_21450 protein n=1 Tax=Aphanomyces stellatus TaxID=120398 RepID=A0A485LHK8_9STRA|nr:hypothetical protein As57867_021381 [Aphanomyces stellatus]VFT98121.1 Aste57867_21450 [Aphanomyces stellatus]
MKIGSSQIHLRSWNEFTRHLVFELKIALKEWKWMLFGLLWQYLHSIFHNLAYWMQTKLTLEQRMPLYDSGFVLLGEFTESQAHISEYMVFGGIFGPCIVLFASVLLIKNNPGARPRYFILIVKRVLLQTAICLALRCCTFLVTSLPGAAPHCRPLFNQTCLDANAGKPDAAFVCAVPNPDFDPPMTAWKVLTHIDALNGCGDLMFSSHTTYTLSMILAVWKYYRSTPALVVMLLFQVVIAFCIVAGRKHYSSDVVTALYVVPMVWFMQEAYMTDLNHKDAVVSPETIKATYGLDVPDDASESSGHMTLENDSNDAYEETATPAIADKTPSVEP